MSDPYDNPNVRWEYPQRSYFDLYPNALNIYGVGSSNPYRNQQQLPTPEQRLQRLSLAEQEKLQKRWTAFDKKDLRGARAPTMNWANRKALFTVGQGDYNAKTMPLISEGNQIYGIGLANYNWTPGNIHQRVDTIRKNKDVKAGGQKQLWDYWNKWVTERSGWHVNRRSALKRYLTEGDSYLKELEKKQKKNPDFVSPLRLDDVLYMADQGLRETARHQQHKGNFWSKTWDAIKNPETWMNAYIAYNTGNPQWAHRTRQGIEQDLRGPGDKQDIQYGTVAGSQSYDPFPQHEPSRTALAQQGLSESGHFPSTDATTLPTSGQYKPGDVAGEGTTGEGEGEGEGEGAEQIVADLLSLLQRQAPKNPVFPPGFRGGGRTIPYQRKTIDPAQLPPSLLAAKMGNYPGAQGLPTAQQYELQSLLADVGY
tara:strand:+ start:3689 stop:4963 length:1275 start_codon:yes stop_codon:yes gene_type:complete